MVGGSQGALTHGAQEQHRKRHLLRLWISPPNDRELPQVYQPLWGSITPGQRGGIWGMTAQPTVPLEAE